MLRQSCLQDRIYIFYILERLKNNMMPSNRHFFIGGNIMRRLIINLK